MTECIPQSYVGRAAELLRRGEIVAFPTETVYGLGARIFSEEAVRKIFIAKGRPEDNPLIAHIADLSSLDSIARDVPDLFYTLAEAFFPGPLTLVIPKAFAVPSVVSAGLSSLGVRMPSLPIARELIRLVGEPLVAPSANLSGKPSATHFLHVLEDFEGRIPAVLMGESSEIGIESTVVSLLEGKVEILRPGAVCKDRLEEVVKRKISLFIPSSQDVMFPSPGMKYRHYAPKAPVVLCFTLEEVWEKMEKSSSEKKMLLSNRPVGQNGIDEFPLSARLLYETLRLSDREGYEEIFILCGPEERENSGLMNRLEKASLRC